MWPMIPSPTFCTKTRVAAVLDIVESGPVDYQEVYVFVVIEIEKSRHVSIRFDDVVYRFIAGNVQQGHPRLLGHVDEAYPHGRGRGLVREC